MLDDFLDDLQVNSASLEGIPTPPSQIVTKQKDPSRVAMGRQLRLRTLPRATTSSSGSLSTVNTPPKPTHQLVLLI